LGTNFHLIYGETIQSISLFSLHHNTNIILELLAILPSSYQ
jgi:hypothetical protein